MYRYDADQEHDGRANTGLTGTAYISDVIDLTKINCKQQNTCKYGMYRECSKWWFYDILKAKFDIDGNNYSNDGSGVMSIFILNDKGKEMASQSACDVTADGFIHSRVYAEKERAKLISQINNGQFKNYIFVQATKVVQVSAR